MTGIDTTSVTIGGQDYLMLDWNLKTAQKISPPLDLLKNPELEDRVGVLAKIIFLGLQESYPELTEDFILQNAKYYELPGFMDAINAQLYKKKPQTKDPEVTNQLIGEKSTQEL